MIGAILTLIQDEARRIWVHRWLGLAVAGFIFVAGSAYVMTMPRSYDAWGQVYVDKQTSVTEAARGVSLEGSGSASVVEKTLLNDQNLERMVHDTDPTAAQMGRAEMAKAVMRLRERIKITSDGEGFFEFHFKDTDPVRAADMVKRLVDQFIGSNVNRSRVELVKAGSFLDEQISAYKTLLADSQGRLDALRRGNAGLTVASSLAPASAAPEESSTEEVVVAAPSPARRAQAAKSAAAAERVATLQAKLEQLRGEYTDEYPDVVTTRRQLADAMASQDLADGVAPTRDTPTRRIIHRVKPRPVVSPAAAAAWADAMRNAEMLRTNYQQLIARREATRMSLAVLGSDSSGKFQVTRAPTIPIVPEGPRRLIFLAGVLIAAIVGGLGAAYLRGALRGIMVSPRELEMACQLPVIGTVSWEPAWSTHRRRDRGIARIRRVTPKSPRRPALGWLPGRKTVREAR